MNVIVCPEDPSGLPEWLCSVCNSWSGADQAVVVDFSRAAWIKVPGQVVDVLRRTSVSIAGVYTGDDRPIPKTVPRVNIEGGRPSWSVISDVEVLDVSHRIRGGQVIRHDGDVEILGDVPPGAEVFAGGSVLIRGDLRGRVTAGERSSLAQILCHSLQPEMISVSNKPVSGDRIPPSWWGDKALIRLNEEKVRFEEVPEGLF